MDITEFGPHPEFGPPPDVSASVAPPVVELGRPTVLFVTVRYPAQFQSVRLRRPSDFEPVFEVRRQEKTTRPLPAGRLETTFELEVVPWYNGKFNVPPVTVVYVVDGRAYRVKTKPVLINVLKLVGEGDTPRANGPPVIMMVERYWPLYLAAGIGALLVLLLVLFFMTRKWREKRAQNAPRWTAPPQEVARARLLRLRDVATPDPKAVKYVVAEMTDILREYLSAVDPAITLDQTTGEMEAMLLERHQTVGQELVAWFLRCDFVKFSRAPEVKQQVQDQIEQALGFVEQIENQRRHAGASAETH